MHISHGGFWQLHLLNANDLKAIIGLTIHELDTIHVESVNRLSGREQRASRDEKRGLDEVLAAAQEQGGRALQLRTKVMVTASRIDNTVYLYLRDSCWVAV